MIDYFRSVWASLRNRKAANRHIAKMIQNPLSEVRHAC